MYFSLQLTMNVSNVNVICVLSKSSERLFNLDFASFINWYNDSSWPWPWKLQNLKKKLNYERAPVYIDSVYGLPEALPVRHQMTFPMCIYVIGILFFWNERIYIYIYTKSAWVANTSSHKLLLSCIQCRKNRPYVTFNIDDDSKFICRLKEFRATHSYAVCHQNKKRHKRLYL